MHLPAFLSEEQTEGGTPSNKQTKPLDNPKSPDFIMQITPSRSSYNGSATDVDNVDGNMGMEIAGDGVGRWVLVLNLDVRY